jgi:hypothetical protein
MAAPVQSATLYGGDLPDVALGVGQSGDNVFDLGSFFDTTTGTATYTSTGGSVNGSMGSVFGGQNPGRSDVTFTASANGETVNGAVSVFVNSFSIGNAPDPDNNNRLAGQAAGNLFLNALSPGETVNSAVNLSGLPAGGSASPGGSTGGGVTGGASLIATIASFEVSRTDSGLIERDVNILASGAGTAQVAGQLTATLNQNGSYTLTAGNDISGDYIVSFGAQAGQSADGVHLVAAEAVSVNLSSAASLFELPGGTATGASVAYGANGAVFTVPPQAAMLIVTQQSIPVDDETVTISANVQTGATTASIAVVGFDTAGGLETLAASGLSYSNPGGTNLQANAMKNIATTLYSRTGGVIPGVQVFNSGTANLTVTVSSLEVVMAHSVVDYALNPNATVDLAVEGSIDGLNGWLVDILGDVVDPTLNASENNFMDADSEGSLLLAGTGTGGVSNTLAQVALEAGHAVAECHVKRVGNGDAASRFVITYVDGGPNAFASFVAGNEIDANSWELVQTSGTLSAASNGFLAVQAAGVDVLVDDVQIRVIDDNDAWFDADLLGL